MIHNLWTVLWLIIYIVIDIGGLSERSDCLYLWTRAVGLWVRDSFEKRIFVSVYLQGDQKVSVHLIITVKNTQKYFKKFQPITMET
jgi:hypothetical protein